MDAHASEAEDLEALSCYRGAVPYELSGILELAESVSRSLTQLRELDLSLNALGARGG